jgi:hypothetical protein
MAKSGGTRAPGKKKKKKSKSKLAGLSGYNPAIDEKISNAEIELADFLDDARTKRKDTRKDFKTARGNRTQSWQDTRDALQTTLRGHRDNATTWRGQLATDEGDAAEIFENDLQDISQGYDLRGASQADHAVARGVGGGGTLAAARAIRAARQAEDVDAREGTYGRQTVGFGQRREGIQTGLTRAEDQYGTDFTVERGGKRTDQKALRTAFNRRRRNLRKNISRARRNTGRDIDRWENTAIRQSTSGNEYWE